MLYSKCAFYIGCSSLVLSFITLMQAYITSDLSMMNVVMNSSNIMPLYYRVAAMWGSHEGSMLLLALYFSIATVVFCKITYDCRLSRYAIAIQLSIHVVILLFIIFTSNPFIKIFPKPRMGLGLNTILQDYALIIHPPILYWGYAGCAMIYSLAVAACHSRRSSRMWIIFMRPWVMFTWAFLTLGIGLGSWWAYKEIGWGGFWFWDPVENISIMPWLVITALSHSIIGNYSSSKTYRMSIFLGVLAFLTVLIGIFLVRAGVLKSVHAFASSPERGMMLLMIVLTYTGYGLWQLSNTYPTNYHTHKILTKKSNKIDIRKAVIVGNYSLIAALSAIAFGTFYPIAVEIFSDESIIVGSNYFNLTVNVAILCGLAVCISVTVRLIPTKVKALQQYIAHFIAAVLLICICYYFAEGKTMMLVHRLRTLDHLDDCYLDIVSLFGIGMSLYMLIAIAQHITSTTRWNMMLGHTCFSVAILAISVCSYAGVEQQKVLTIGNSMKFLDYKIKLCDIRHAYRSNYIAKTAVITVHTGTSDYILEPEVRMFPLEKQTVVEPAILRHILYDLNISFSQVGQVNKKSNSFLISVYYRPMLNWLWAAILLMFVIAIVKAMKLFFSIEKKTL